MRTNNRQQTSGVLLPLPAARLHARRAARVIPLPERPYDIRSALQFVLLSLAVSLALLVVFAVAFRSTRELTGAFLPGLTWW